MYPATPLYTFVDIFWASVSRSTFMKIQVHMQWGGGVVARIHPVHGINSIPAWDGLRPTSAGNVMKQ